MVGNGVRWQRTDFFSGNLHPYFSSGRNDWSSFSFSTLVWSRDPFSSSCSNTVPAVWQASESLHFIILGQACPTGPPAAWAQIRSFLGQQEEKVKNHLSKPTTWRREDHCVTRGKRSFKTNQPPHRRCCSHSSSCVSSGNVRGGSEWLQHTAWEQCCRAELVAPTRRCLICYIVPCNYSIIDIM